MCWTGTTRTTRRPEGPATTAGEGRGWARQTRGRRENTLLQPGRPEFRQAFAHEHPGERAALREIEVAIEITEGTDLSVRLLAAGRQLDRPQLAHRRAWHQAEKPDGRAIRTESRVATARHLRAPVLV